VRASTRADDIIARFGGEEFIAIVPGGLESATEIAERVRSGFAAAGATVDSNAIGATVSIGGAVSHEPVTAIDGLIARTDAALYRAKHAGRNRVHIAEEDIANDRTRNDRGGTARASGAGGRSASLVAAQLKSALAAG
jgi:diguanylate cyclase (GGDEF)-like protein